MNLFISWLSFVILVCTFSKFTKFHYFLYSIFMLCFSYFCNLITSTKISLRTIAFTLTIPSVIYWYVAFIYNDFLSLVPMRYEVFISLFLVYLYLLIYIVSKAPTTNRRLLVKK
uniref:Uncharacterized protein n=1 Tax=Nitzschia supralitorea TaxID=303403 RepID=A0A8F1B812_9STRA|nr:hypothetical protein KYU99_mgp21 [Nitzschia supralitorea]QWM93265.1 hypothetical protein [Nitzschia supralitorea]